MKDRGLIMIANMGDDSITIYDKESLDLVKKLIVKPTGNKKFNISHFAKGPIAGPGYLYYCKSKNLIMVLNVYDDSLLMVDLETIEPRDAIFAGNHPNQIEVFDEMDRAFISNYDSDSISVIDLSIPQIIGQIPCGAMPQSIFMNRKTNRLYVANTGSDYVSIIDAVSLDKLCCLELDGYPVDLCGDQDKQRLYIVVRHPERQVTDRLIEYDMTTGKRLGVLNLGLMPVNILLDRVKGKVYAVDAIENNLKVVDIEKFTVENTINLGRMPVGQHKDETGRFLYIVCMIENRLFIIDTLSEKIVKEMDTGIEPSAVLCIG
jgi:YVTN family beta-propeller protein